jgi:CDP-glucose 4,6-dehydratase
MEGLVMFQNAFRGKRILVTGHTGFKGAWLTRWLLDLGAEVTGLALAPNTTPSLFNLLRLKEHVRHHEIDIRDAESLRAVVAKARPEIVLHLAAQALVRLSYLEPKGTWDVNVGGTVNLLEAIRQVNGVGACVVVTSDKCYENREQVWGYRECDPMGGHDPYSSSKGAAELAVASWRNSFFKGNGQTRLGSARAGNVIGGGDWAADRIVVDFVKSIIHGQPLILRNPLATRPWQHVLEPLSGYLALAEGLFRGEDVGLAKGWNFGPAEANVVTVETLTRCLVATWGEGQVKVHRDPNTPHEAGLLKLDCSMAKSALGWHGVWNIEDTVRHTVEWYRGFHTGGDAERLTQGQIVAYQNDATRAKLPWTH